METLDQPEPKKPAPKKESAGLTILSIFVSLYFIIRGSMYMGSNNQGLGIVMLLVGIGGLIFKIYTLVQNK